MMKNLFLGVIAVLTLAANLAMASSFPPRFRCIGEGIFRGKKDKKVLVKVRVAPVPGQSGVSYFGFTNDADKEDIPRGANIVPQVSSGKLVFSQGSSIYFALKQKSGGILVGDYRYMHPNGTTVTAKNMVCEFNQQSR